MIRQALEEMGKKHLIGSRRDCLVPAPTLDEMREARRQNRNTRPALTKHTPIAHQRQNGSPRNETATRGVVKKGAVKSETVKSGAVKSSVMKNDNAKKAVKRKAS
jgi:hypothetical protein